MDCEKVARSIDVKIMFFNRVKKVLKNPSLINKKINSLLGNNLKKTNKVFRQSFQ